MVEYKPLEMNTPIMIPVENLTPNVRHVGTMPSYRALCDDIDTHGLRDPLHAWRMKPLEWVERLDRTGDGKGIDPVVLVNGTILVVKYGNQRLRYAKERGYTHVPVVIHPEEP